MADPNSWFDGKVAGVNAWEESTTPDEGGGGDPGGGDGEAHAVALLPIQTPMLVGQSVTVMVFVGDSQGDPVASAAASLIAVGAGHVITPSGTVLTNAAGYAVFTLTVVGVGDLDVTASAAGISSRTTRVYVGQPSVFNGGGGGGGGRGRKRRQPTGADVSYADIGPVEAGGQQPTRAKPPFFQHGGLRQPNAAGGQAAQAAQALAADQQQRLQALVQQLQSDLS